MTHIVKTSGSFGVEWTEDDTVVLALPGGTPVILSRVEAERLGRYLLFRNPEEDVWLGQDNRAVKAR